MRAAQDVRQIGGILVDLIRQTATGTCHGKSEGLVTNSRAAVVAVVVAVAVAVAIAVAVVVAVAFAVAVANC